MKYSCMGIFKHIYENPLRISQYEERVVLIEAASPELATILVDKEFSEYSSEGIELVHAFDLQEIAEEPALVVGISSKMKVFPGDGEEYIERFCGDLRPKSCRDLGWQHVWYHIGHGVSGCYNCQEEKSDNRWENQ